MRFSSLNLFFSYNWYIKYPESKLKSDYYLGPFEIDFWLAIIFSIMLQTISIIVVKYCLKKIVDVEEGNILSANMCVGIETLCNQSGSDGPKNLSFRIIDISLRFLAIFSMNSYGAVIISFLTLKFPIIPFSNLNEFFEVNEYRLVIDSVLSEQMKDALYSVRLLYLMDKKKKKSCVTFIICINNLIIET